MGSCNSGTILPEIIYTCNTEEPQWKHRLGTVSKKKLFGVGGEGERRGHKHV